MKKIWMFLMTIICSIGIAICVAQAWFINGFDVDPLATGSSTEAYYHSGTGTSGDPYIITTPRHLYNLAWLQYLGKYNKDVKDGKNFPATYFKIGTSDGITIDMTDWPLPPIGTAKYPFIGNFNGNGATITNLTTTNKFSEFNGKTPSGVNGSNFEADYCGTIGFFGAIGAYDGNIISESDSTNNSFTYETANNKVYNFYLNDNEVHTCRSTTLIGAVAGYVNAEISNVGVIQPHLDIQESATSKLSSKTSNLSDFAVVGYAEQKYTTQKTKSSTVIYNPTYDYSHFNFKGMGSQADWGGSIDMASLYARINGQINNTSLQTYVNGEIKYNYTHSTVTTSGTPSSAHYYKSFSDGSGAYLTQGTAPNGGYDYLTALYKNVIKVTKTETIENGYTLNSNGQYLNISSSRVDNTLNFNVTIYSDTDESTVWVEEANSGGVNLYTYNEDDGHKYYLVGNSDLSVSVSNTTPSIWHWEGNTYYTSINTVNYYLKYLNDEWTLKPTYAIGDGNGNYMKSDLSNTTNISEAGIWQIFSNGIFINEDDLALHYTTSGNGLELSNSEWTEWNINNGALSYNGSYIQFNGASWVASLPLSFYIYYKNYYLTTTNGTSVSYSNTENSATVWTFEQNTDGNPSGYIYTTINNNNYYLYYNSGNLGITNNTSLRSEFNTNENGIYYDNNGTYYYLQYNSSWNFTATLNQYFITYQEGTTIHYLSLNGTNIIDTTNVSNATLWTFSNPTGSGTVKSGNYYLYMQNGNSLLTTSTNTQNWTVSNDGISNNYGYIQFYNGKWICGKLFSINFESNYLSVNNTSLSNSENPYYWVFSYYNTSGTNTLIYTVINNNIYYLRYSNGLSFDTSTTNNTWRINTNYQIYSSNSTSYFIQCINGTWSASRKYYAYISNGSSHYLSNNGTSLADKRTLDEATLWQFSSYGDKPSGSIHPTLDNTNKYIDYSSSTLGSTAREWDVDGDVLYYYYSWRRSYYIRYSNNSWTSNNTTGGTNLTWILPCGEVKNENSNGYALYKAVSNQITSSNKTSFSSKSPLLTRGSGTINEYTRQDGIREASVFNYIPLNTNNDYSIADNNTGYLMSGGYSGNSGGTSAVDIRLFGGASPYTISWGLSTSVNTDGSIKANSVYTYDSSGHHAINDSNNTFQKYTNSKSDMEKTLKASVKAGQGVAGMHFITSLISINKLVNASKVVINGTEYTNYKMPENSFDFMLKKKGYINFFAGLYYPGNQSFFSLHKVERDSNQTILSIKNISKIYGTDNKRDPYVYLYTDGTYSGGYSSVPSGYTEIFDCTWIESPNITQWDDYYSGNYNNGGKYMKRLYYFEIPVNEGEYCLGSVNGLDGGYLMYLDIGANASVVDRTTITQQSNVVDENMTYATGIQLLADGAHYSYDYNTAVATIEASTTGTINISRTGNTVSFGGTSLNSKYWDEGLTVTDGTLVVPTNTSTTKVLKYIDYNNGTGTLYYATVIYVDDNVDDQTSGTSTYEVREINGTTNPIVADSTYDDDAVDDALYGLLKIGTGEDSGYGVKDTAANAISTNTFSISSNVVEYHYTIPTSVITNDGVAYSFDMSVVQVTGNETIGNFDIEAGEYEFDDGYTSTHCYKLTGDDITYVFTQIPTGTTTTTFVVTTKVGTYTVTINGTTIVVGNYTYTFSTNTIAAPVAP